MQLDNRLSAVADMVGQGGIFADCGTDHAYIPIYLIENGISSRGYASDINLGPLKSAQRNIRNAGLSDKIETILTDGLDGYEDDGITDIIIAGMGGELIQKIVDRSKLAKKNGINLILQPMSHEDKLRVYLSECGFCTVSEKIADDGDKLYVVIKATYTGETFAHGELYPYVGYIDREAENSRLYIEKKLTALNKKIAGLENSGKYKDETEVLRRHVAGLTEILKERIQ